MTAKRVLSLVLRRVGLALLALVALLLLVICYGLVREALTRTRYLSQYSPPGRMVDIGTHKLHLDCAGMGSPTVVFEADLDAIGSQTWALVQPEIAKRTRACAYDRAGILWSEAGPRPRDGEEIAQELLFLLDAAGEPGPYILVGHAAGGAYTRIVAGQQRELVCGIVLVDSVHPDQTNRLAEVGITSQQPSSQMRPLVVLFARLGVPRRYVVPKPRTMTDEAYDIEQAFLPASSVAWFDETVGGVATMEQAGLVNDLGDIPLIVLASSRPAAAAAGLPSNEDPQEVWLELQRELIELSSNGELRSFADSGHYIQFDRPDAVTVAIEDVIANCRTGG